ncbi:GNAT family N-acetyltransferase [Ornithinicoccus halotolerans]|uniref:GNAT family N-acetyltransferase n=1 Tax=Ornithinicoccus halotolerans TaxID=1748220 RepID=UPI001294916F|nr:GNAT family N-acetyltransferase [Ornithinicoccus halotolerans]
MSEVTVVQRPGESRFEAHVDGQLAGVLVYQQVGTTLDLAHTEVDPAFEGQGVASRLVAGALDRLRGSEHRVAASCPYVRRWLERHEDYRDVVSG